MKRLSKEQIDLLEMLAHTRKLKHVPGALASLSSLEKMRFVGRDFQLTDEGRVVLQDQQLDPVKRRTH